jgi:hypothetical protein
MTPCPQIATYRLSCGPGGIPSWLARYVVTKRNPKSGAVSTGFLPMVFEASYEAGAIEAAESFWASEQAKIDARADRLAAARDTRKRRGMEGTA